MKAIILLPYAWFCWLMLEITLQYNSFSTDVAFLKIKQDYTPFLHYRIAFFTHVYSAIFVLSAGFTQFFPLFRTKYPQVHRLCGKLYAYITLILAAPSGFVIGLYANGGIFSRIAFCMLAVLWWYYTYIAMRKIIAKDFVKHRNFMIRSFALALSAITLRAWKYAIVAAFHPRPMDAYRIVAWLGWVLNLIIAEIIIYKMSKKISAIRKALIFTFGTLLLFSCGPGKKEKIIISESEIKKLEEQARIEDSIAAAKSFQTNYPKSVVPIETFTTKYFTGNFEAMEYDKNSNLVFSYKITLCIDSAHDNFISGFTVCSGNKRPFKGNVTDKKPGEYACEVKEPGDNKYDGVFRLVLNTENNTITGNWFANNQRLPVKSRSYALFMTTFKYDPEQMPDNLSFFRLYNDDPKVSAQYEVLTDAVNEINASTTELQTADVENLYKGDLEVIRNTIYARHGYAFKTKRMQLIFDQHTHWYVPISTNVEDQLTPLERKNVELLKRYEKFAKSYYDVFGR